jgi:hypothetical protein
MQWKWFQKLLNEYCLHYDIKYKIIFKEKNNKEFLVAKEAVI